MVEIGWWYEDLWPQLLNPYTIFLTLILVGVFQNWKFVVSYIIERFSSFVYDCHEHSSELIDADRFSWIGKFSKNYVVIKTVAA